MIRFLIVLLTLVVIVPGASVGAQAVACDTFDAFEWAQSVYESDPAAYAALDPDGDGIACPELGSGAAPALWTTSVPAGAEPVRVYRVVDGDTVDFVRGDGRTDRVRLILSDTPETVHPSEPEGCFGREANDFTTWLLSLGADVYLERDVSERDQFDRLLRYVWLDFGGSEVYLLNEALVRSGYAALSTFPPDVKYVDEVQAAQQFAQRHERGLWGACASFGAPASAPQPAAPAPAANPPPSRAQPAAAPPLAPQARAVPAGDCDPSYPDICLPSSPDLNCGDIPHRRFTVLPPDPHNFDGDHDQVGCES